MLINANGLKKSFGERVLFSDVAFSVEDKDKIGFIGSNGTGKSTLIKILMGEIEYEGGEIFKSKQLKAAYLEQYTCSDSDNTVFGEVLSAFSEVEKIEEELEDVCKEIENGSEKLEELVAVQQKLQSRFEELNGFYYKGLVRSCLMGLGFAEEELEKNVKDLSGGEKTRVSLAKILLSDCNLLFLDEPTNHLDIEAVEWLEDFLRGYGGAFIVISHDRYFLDRVTQKTFSLENGKLYCGNGNYSTFMKQREIERLTAERNYKNTQNEIERLEGIIEQQRRWNREKNIKTAESKQKVLDKLYESLDKPQDITRDFSFSFSALAGGGEEVLSCRSIAKAFDEAIISNADVDIKKGEFVFLLGKNGCGKTTLLKMICGTQKPDNGTIKIGTGIKIGYYDQIQENLNTGKTVIDEVWDEYPKMTETQIRNALAAFLFKGDEVFKEVEKLSGGERARVQLVKLILKPVNFLILDEPTNHLDIESREALENALASYDGTVLSVSHDRYFIQKLATRILNFENSGIKNYGGGYEYFLEKRTESEETVEVKTKKLDYAEQKAIAAEARKKASRLKKTEEKIEELEKKINGLNDELMQTGSDCVKAAELAALLDEKNEELSKLYNIWEELQ